MNFSVFQFLIITDSLVMIINNYRKIRMYLKVFDLIFKLSESHYIASATTFQKCHQLQNHNCKMDNKWLFFFQSNKKQRTTNIKEKPKKLTKQQLAKEKERLQILEREYAQKIEELKKAQEKQVKKAKSTNSNTTEKQLPKVKRKSLSNMPQPDTANMDKIELNYVESENVSDIVVQSKRRRSLLDLNPSMKPNIEMDKEDILKDGIFSEMGKNDNTASNVEKESSGKKFKFAMPLGQQLDNLQRVQVNYFMEVSSRSHGSPTQIVNANYATSNTSRNTK